MVKRSLLCAAPLLVLGRIADDGLCAQRGCFCLVAEDKRQSGCGAEPDAFGCDVAVYRVTNGAKEPIYIFQVGAFSTAVKVAGRLVAPALEPAKAPARRLLGGSKRQGAAREVIPWDGRQEHRKT